MSDRTPWIRQAAQPWPRNTPDVLPSGLVLLESRMVPVAHGEPDGDIDDDFAPIDFRWNVYAVGFDNDDDSIGMIGDLFICNMDWHLTVSAICPLQVRGLIRKHAVDAGLDELSERWGPYTNHLLWDFVAQHARILTSGVLEAMPLPPTTPSATYGPDRTGPPQADSAPPS